jgi:hypothetical protein
MKRLEEIVQLDLLNRGRRTRYPSVINKDVETAKLAIDLGKQTDNVSLTTDICPNSSNVRELLMNYLER